MLETPLNFYVAQFPLRLTVFIGLLKKLSDLILGNEQSFLRNLIVQIQELTKARKNSKTFKIHCSFSVVSSTSFVQVTMVL